LVCVNLSPKGDIRTWSALSYITGDSYTSPRVLFRGISSFYFEYTATSLRSLLASGYVPGSAQLTEPGGVTDVTPLFHTDLCICFPLRECSLVYAPEPTKVGS